MTKYKDYKQWNEARTQEVNQFVELNCIFAFGRDQLQEALKEHNLTEKEFERLSEHCSKIRRVLIASRTTAKENMNRGN